MLSTRSRAILRYSSGLLLLLCLVVVSRGWKWPTEAIYPAVTKTDRGLPEGRPEDPLTRSGGGFHRPDDADFVPKAIGISTDPNDLATILREVEAVARKNPRASAERATAALCGLAVADPADEPLGQGEETVYLTATHMPAVLGLARKVFAGDRAYGGGLSERLPDAMRDAVISGIVREDVDTGDTEKIVEWIEGMPDHDTAEIAKWELARRMFQEHGSVEGLAMYPSELIRDLNERRAVAHRFSVIEGQHSITR